MNVSTALVLAIVIACICLSIRSFRKKGMCGCKEHCGGSCASCSSNGCSPASCPACSVLEGVKIDGEEASKDLS